MLSAGVAANPAGLRAAKDRIAIAGWADLDAEVIKGYAALPSDARSDPAMIEAVARAYRNQKRFAEANMSRCNDCASVMGIPPALTITSPGRSPEASAGPPRTTSTIRSEEHTSELPSLLRISYADLCLKKKK